MVVFDTQAAISSTLFTERHISWWHLALKNEDGYYGAMICALGLSTFLAILRLFISLPTLASKIQLVYENMSSFIDEDTIYINHLLYAVPLRSYNNFHITLASSHSLDQLWPIH